MQYLQDGPFLDWRGQPLTIGGEPVTVCSLLALLVGGWQPLQGVKETNLTPAQVRTWQRLMADLEKGPEGGYLALEDDRFALARSLALALMAGASVTENGVKTSLARHLPQLEDILSAVTSKKSPNGVPDEVKARV